MTLHTLNLSSDSANLSICFAQLTKGDAVVMLGQGVEVGESNNPYTATIKTLSQDNQISFFVLEDDLRGAGLEQSLLDCITTIDYVNFVQLAVEHEKTVNWF